MTHMLARVIVLLGSPCLTLRLCSLSLDRPSFSASWARSSCYGGRDKSHPQTRPVDGGEADAHKMYTPSGRKRHVGRGFSMRVVIAHNQRKGLSVGKHDSLPDGYFRGACLQRAFHGPFVVLTKFPGQSYS